MTIISRHSLGVSCATLAAVVFFAPSSVNAQSSVTPAGFQATPPAKLTQAEIEAARTSAPFKQFSAWLAAFNSADQNRLRQYIDANHPTSTVASQMNWRVRTGGFEFRAFEDAAPRSITGLMEERETDQFVRFNFVVDDIEPHRILRFTVQAIARPAEFPIARLTESDLVGALRTKLEKDTAADRFSGAALVARIGNGSSQVLFSGAYGLADREKKIANTLDTRFRLGSINKMFTAVAILQLVQAGKIGLNDPVGTYITDYRNTEVASRVSIHHLLMHTGGTGDIFGGDFNAHRLELKTLDDYMALYGNRAPAYEPGTRWAYSNYGMILLGIVIERVSGQSYYDYVAQHIYKPAGMTRTGSAPENEQVPDRSVGYMRVPGQDGWTPNTGTLPYRGTSAGGGYSTVGDLLKFATALIGNRLLNAELTNILITGKVNVVGSHMYAYGFEDGRTNGDGAVGHGGGAPGMNGDLRIYPKSGYVVAVLSNMDPPSATQVSAFLDWRLPSR